jgi:ribosomal protein L6P/L9E
VLSKDDGNTVSVKRPRQPTQIFHAMTISVEGSEIIVTARMMRAKQKPARLTRTLVANMGKVSQGFTRAGDHGFG